MIVPRGSRAVAREDHGEKTRVTLLQRALRMVLPSVALILSTIGPAATSTVITAQSGQIELEFIGNMAFRITDGQTTLLSDFPYESGAFGYMEYEMEEVGPIVDGVSLITHEHRDHWDAGLFRDMNLRVIAHPDIVRGLPANQIIPWSERITYKDIVVEPVRTAHTDAHSSYRVTWHGRRLYFTGDTTSTEELLAQENLDVAFVSPWLLETLAAGGRRVDTELLVVYHHVEGQPVERIQNMLQPRQGQRFQIE